MVDAARLGAGMADLASRTTDDGEADAELVSRAATDRDAFARLYTRYVGPVYRYCFHTLGNREMAEDATSLVFVQALAALPRYRERGSFRAWLFAIAHNVIVDQARRSRQTLVPLDGSSADRIPDPGSTPETAALADESATTLRHLLGTLPPEQRQVMELRLSGLTSPEVGRVLGRSPNAVRSLQYRAIDRLRRLLAEEGARDGAI